MIEIGTIGIRYLEAAVLVLLLVATVLVFVKRRPAGLVWFSALAMVVLAVHLYLEQARWQLVPAYVLVFILSFWLARPAGQAYRSARAYRSWGLIVRIMIAVLVVPSLLLPYAAPLFLLAEPDGPHPVGAATVFVQSADEGQERRQLSVWYPARAGASTVAPFWSETDLAHNRLPGLPWIMATHLTLVPTPAYHRAPIVDAPLPLLVLLPAEGALPGDYLHLVLEAAGAGWLVVELRGEPGEQVVRETIARLDTSDAALAGRVNLDRTVVAVIGDAPDVDLGVPTLRIGGPHLLEARLPSGRFALAAQDAEIPQQAFTVRHHMVRPARLLVGSSDITPRRLGEFLRRTVRTVLGDGAGSAPVFSSGGPDQQKLLEAMDGVVIRRLPDAPR